MQFKRGEVHPYQLSGITLVGMLVVSLVGLLLQKTGWVEVGERFAWLTAASFLFVYSIFNSLLSLFSHSLNTYWTQSILAFVVLAGASAGLAYVFSGIPMEQAGSYWWIFIVVSIGYLVFLSVMRMARNIVEFAEQEEWHAPKQRW